MKSDYQTLRVEKHGDLFEPVIKKKQKLPQSLLKAMGGTDALEKMANRRHSTGGGRRYPPQ